MLLPSQSGQSSNSLYHQFPKLFACLDLVAFWSIPVVTVYLMLSRLNKAVMGLELRRQRNEAHRFHPLISNINHKYRDLQE
jgi:hypothetical protein